jgi:tRNA U34 5-methylaminomethyl-2-thiouridine-forming methyltransferase MnmC
MTFELVATADGSLSCRDSETGQLCHNRAGAYTEALTHYAIPSEAIALAEQQGEIRLLDACYGLGYNTWVLADYLLKAVPSPFTLSVVAVERSADIVGFLPQLFEHPTLDDLKNKIDASEHNIHYRTQSCCFNTKDPPENGQQYVIDVADGRRIQFELILGDLREEVPRLEKGDFDLIFHDPFSPQKMPELWTVDLFRHYHRLLQARQGRILTYSGAAAVRGGLREAGFAIGKTQALGAKTGGTMAWIPTVESPESLESFEAWEWEYLQTRAGLPYRDETLCHAREDILQRRETEQAQSSRPSGATILRQRRHG